ncbi:SDR family NAD(P)-dependent oxidoreductase [Nocardia spumae]|uniref:SDR family NAD(P)-dependent oxidoreductase n=1 Tax=Nocardia spumae TaxID=2887190 RepID=UPI001D13BD98|nr:SDR family oxidoreductase [Nocardia spumae]
MSTGETTRRVCLLTGAGGRLGDAFCRAYYNSYDIVAVCRNRVPAAPSQDEWFIDPLEPWNPVPENDSRIFVVRADLSRPGEADRVVDIALAKYGAVDLLVNNAAQMTLHPNGLVDGEVALDGLAPAFTMNVEVPLRLATRLAQRCWLHRGDENRARNRNIVNVSSLSGSRVYTGGQAIYAASKAALDHLTRHIAVEFAEFGVRANGIAPTAFPALVPTEVVAAAIAELDSGYLNGGIYGVGDDDAAISLPLEPAAPSPGPPG